ncbi:hypothetical protein CSW58_13110 [Caulobacter sp. B11]|nr:hypothetical protein CSW58_13110 [Caulobacter sp. B11]
MLAVVVLAASSNAFAGEATDQRGERSLARVIEGREAGRPVDCIDARSVVATEIVDKTALVYRTPSGQLYVNRPQAGAKVLTRDMVTRQGPRAQLCKQDSLAVFWAAGGHRGVRSPMSAWASSCLTANSSGDIAGGLTAALHGHSRLRGRGRSRGLTVDSRQIEPSRSRLAGASSMSALFLFLPRSRSPPATSCMRSAS